MFSYCVYDPKIFAKKVFFVLCYLLVFCITVIATAAQAASVTLEWDRNEEPDVAGYKIYYRTETAQYAEGLTVYDSATKPLRLSRTVYGLSDGTTYFFAVTCFDAAGQESHYSEEVSYTTSVALNQVTYNIALAANGATALGGWDVTPLIDGQTTGYTGSSGYAGASWNQPMTITLDNVYTVNEIHVLLWDLDDRYYQYKVETSLDSLEWTTVVDKTFGTWRGWQIDTIDPINARYLRIIGTYNSANEGFHVVEMEAYTNGTILTPTLISSEYNIALRDNGAIASGGLNSEPLNDGEISGYTEITGHARASWNQPMTITLDNVYTVNEIHVLLWDLDDRYYQYKVETSLNNVEWTTVIDKTYGTWSSWQRDAIDPINARYLRIIGTYNSANERFHVVEMEAYTE